MKCHKCNTDNNKESSFCTNCGSELIQNNNSISCPNCGTENENTSNFCVKCGNIAQFSHRLSDKEQVVLLGEKDIYEPLCRRCFKDVNQK